TTYTPISFFLTIRPRPRPTLFPYTTLFRSIGGQELGQLSPITKECSHFDILAGFIAAGRKRIVPTFLWSVQALTEFPEKQVGRRSEEHTSELQSRENLVCRLLLEKKKQPRA